MLGYAPDSAALCAATARIVVAIGDASAPHQVVYQAAHALAEQLGTTPVAVPAPLAAEWLADRLGCRVVVIVSDPAAMVASWKRLGWTTDLGELLHQPALMRDWLGTPAANRHGESEGAAWSPACAYCG
jgi:hypothetical protein